MNALKQISAVTRLNLRSLPLRLGTSSVIVIGIAGVVGVLVSILAMVAGLSQMMSSNARPDRAIVISTGSSFEMLSDLSRAATSTIVNAPGIRRGADGKPSRRPKRSPSCGACCGTAARPTFRCAGPNPRSSSCVRSSKL